MRNQFCFLPPRPLRAAVTPRAFAAATTEPTKEHLEFFESKIRPILAENCYKCHSVEQGKSKGELTSIREMRSSKVVRQDLPSIPEIRRAAS
jgi:hypothetical protein